MHLTTAAALLTLTSSALAGITEFVQPDGGYVYQCDRNNTISWKKFEYPEKPVALHLEDSNGNLLGSQKVNPSDCSTHMWFPAYEAHDCKLRLVDPQNKADLALQSIVVDCFGGNLGDNSKSRDSGILINGIGESQHDGSPAHTRGNGNSSGGPSENEGRPRQGENSENGQPREGNSEDDRPRQDGSPRGNGNRPQGGVTGKPSDRQPSKGEEPVNGQPSKGGKPGVGQPVKGGPSEAGKSSKSGPSESGKSSKDGKSVGGQQSKDGKPRAERPGKGKESKVGKDENPNAHGGRP